MISLSKDKIDFRKTLQKIYPDYFFKEVNFSELKQLDLKVLKFPLILKPSVGFLSFGVYPVKSSDLWLETVSKLEGDLKKLEGIFPKSVVNMERFIIEELIEGDEFALDAYFDNEGKATILNIFHHPFFDENDVSDRAYYTSKAIIEKYLDKFTDVLNKIGEAGNYKNFPFHLELRANDSSIIPIEINPLRFCGWCITDIAHFAYGINVYEYFLNQKKPDWQKILKEDDGSFYYFTMADISSSIDRTKIKDIDFEAYLKNISNPLEIRKTDYKKNPVFAIVFAKTDSIDEIKNILKVDMSKYLKY